MGSVRDRLVAAADVRSKPLKIGDVSFIVREVSVQAFADYGVKLAEDKVAANAILIADCVLEEDGSLAFTLEDAAQIAKSARLATPIMNAIMQLSGFAKADEKKPDAS